MKKAEKKLPADWESFGRDLMNEWPEGDIDGGSLQELAVKHHIIVPVPGGYDPKEHSYNGYAEPGDPWFLRNYDPKNTP